MRSKLSVLREEANGSADWFTYKCEPGPWPFCSASARVSARLNSYHFAHLIVFGLELGRFNFVST